MKFKFTNNQLDTIDSVADFLNSQDHDPEIRPMARKFDKIAEKIREEHEKC